MAGHEFSLQKENSMQYRVIKPFDVAVDVPVKKGETLALSAEQAALLAGYVEPCKPTAASDTSNTKESTEKAK